MKYHISIPGYIDVATCNSIKDVKKALEDGGCIRRPNMATIIDMVDSLNSDGVWTHPFADDRRFEFVVEVVE